MRLVALIAFGFLALVSSCVTAIAWSDTAHMAIAGIAYDRLEPKVRLRVNELIKLNPDYPNWIAGIHTEDEAKYAFMRAAVWADDIRKENSGYAPDPGTDAGSEGYDDKAQHSEWHYLDIPYSKDGSNVRPPTSPNALTQLKILTQALASGDDDRVRSFDLVWILHIAGDLHQPLHVSMMFSEVHRDGDQGGNALQVSHQGSQEVQTLHNFWDTMLERGDARPIDAIALISTLSDADAQQAKVLDPAQWVLESFAIAQNVVYAHPVGLGIGPYDLSQAYIDTALFTAQRQVALAGARLGNLLNDTLRLRVGSPDDASQSLETNTPSASSSNASVPDGKIRIGVVTGGTVVVEVSLSNGVVKPLTIKMLTATCGANTVERFEADISTAVIDAVGPVMKLSFLEGELTSAHVKWVRATCG